MMQMCVFCKYTKWTNPSKNIFYLFSVCCFFFLLFHSLSLECYVSSIFRSLQLSKAFFIRALSCSATHNTHTQTHIFPNAGQPMAVMSTDELFTAHYHEKSGRANECFSTSKHFMCTHVLWLFKNFNQTTVIFCCCCCIAVGFYAVLVATLSKLFGKWVCWRFGRFSCLYFNRKV